MKGNTCVSNTLEKVENLIRISSSGYEKKKKKKRRSEYVVEGVISIIGI